MQLVVSRQPLHLPAAPFAKPLNSTSLSHQARCPHHQACCSLQGAEQCHTDIIRSIVCTDMGFIVTLSYDRAMYIYGEERMTTPTRVRKASAARFTAVAWDKANNWLLTGAADGCVKVWSQEGRILDELMHTSDQVCTCTSWLHA